MAEITKATRFQIIKPLDVSWDEFGQVLRNLSYHTTKMCNAAVRLYWEYHTFVSRTNSTGTSRSIAASENINLLFQDGISCLQTYIFLEEEQGFFRSTDGTYLYFVNGKIYLIQNPPN